MEDNLSVLNGLFYFKESQPTQCFLFSNEELFRIVVSAQIMARLFKNLNRSIAVEDAYEEFLNEAHHVSSDNPYEQGKVDRRFRSFIIEWKLYTEHWKAYIEDLEDSVYPDEFVEGYKVLRKTLMDQAFDNPDFVVAHVIRNFVSHANEAVTHSHIGENNEFCVGRDHLLEFLNTNIEGAHGKKRQQFEKHRAIIENQEKYINLEEVAHKAIKWLRQFETAMMDYQIEPQTIQACNILTDAKNKIDNAGLVSDRWAFFSTEPIKCIDHSAYQSITLTTTVEAKQITIVRFLQYLHWNEYQAMMAVIISRIERTRNELET